MSSFSTYLIGFIIFVVGVSLAAFYLGAPPMWIGIGVVILIGIGVLSATRNEKRRDPPSV